MFPFMNCAQIETLVTREVCEEPAGPVCKTVKTVEVEEICAPNKVKLVLDIFTNTRNLIPSRDPSNKAKPLLDIVIGSNA